MNDPGGTCGAVRADLEVRVAAFEAACAGEWPVDPARFAPPPDHPEYAETVCELVRVHLEAGWGRGDPTPLAEYRRRFPAVFARADLAAAVRFEDDRLRAQHQPGPDPSADRHTAATEVSATPPPVVVASRWESLSARPARSGPALPAVGSTFLGFHLLEELGRGSFGRVYLAQQKALSDRPVALKLTTRLNPEAQFLARLQHTNIMPVLSVHEAGGVQAVCMPYHGRITLAHVLRSVGQGNGPRTGRSLVSDLGTLAARTASARSRHTLSGTLRGESTAADKSGPPPAPSATDFTPPAVEHAPIRDMLSGMSFADAVVWLGARLADGLAHAHERGILHRDLKPENVLLGDDGQPMLLDFNLADDATPAVPKKGVGGTLLYMAPEHLAAFAGKPDEPLGPRTDLYALGLVLYELLAGKHPSPLPTERATLLADLRAARLRPPVPLRSVNPAVPADVAAAVTKLLDPDPAKRYPSARALADDLDRHLTHRPLLHAREPLACRVRKWARRNPRLLPLMGMAAAVLLAAGLTAWVGAAMEARARDDAADARERFRDDLREAEVLLAATTGDVANRTAGADRLRAALGRYAAADDADWHRLPNARRLGPAARAGLREDVGEALLLLARATAADDPAAAVRLNRRAEAEFAAGGVPSAVWRQRAELLDRVGEASEAAAAREKAAEPATATARAAYLDGTDLAVAGRFAEAIPPLEEACRLDPSHPAAAFTLAFCLTVSGREAEALEHYRACIALRPTFPWAYFNRGLLHLGRGDDKKARADLNEAVRLKPDWAEAVFTRGTLHHRAARWAEAWADYDAAERLGYTRPRLYLLRSEAKFQLRDPSAADDRAKGFDAPPVDAFDFTARGVDRLPLDPEGALAEFDRALTLDPRHLIAHQNKAHVLGELLKDTAGAVAVLDRVVGLYPHYTPARASRGVLLARLGKRADAQRDARAVLRQNPAPAVVYQLAGVYALTAKGHPDDMKEAVRLLAAAFAAGFGDFATVDADPDLDPVRATPEFKAVVREFRPKPGQSGN